MAFLLGLCIGFIMCIPVGPLNIWVMQTKMRKGARAALLMAAGGSFLDFLYFFAIISGLSLISFPETVVQFLKVLGPFLLFVFGLKELFQRQEISLDTPEQPERRKQSNYFLLGALIYAANPTLVVSVSGICAVVKSWQVFSSSFLNHLLFSTGTAIGSWSWFYFVVRQIKKYRHHFGPQLMRKLNVICGLLILVISGVMFYQTRHEFYSLLLRRLL